MSATPSLPVLLAAMAIGCGADATSFFGDYGSAQTAGASAVSASGAGASTVGGGGGSDGGAASIGGTGGSAQATAGSGTNSSGVSGVGGSDAGVEPPGGSGGTEPSEGGSVGQAGSGGDGCDPSTWYADTDGDGFGDPGTTQESCSKPDGYVNNPDDCYDGNALASPVPPYPNNSHEEDRGDGSWDYDCDGEETPLWTNFGSCPDTTTDPITPGMTGWYDPTFGADIPIPACGEEEHWKSNAASCPGVLLGVTQRCK